MQKWEKYEKIRDTLKKIQGLEDADVDKFFEFLDETGTPVTDEMLPFFATILSLLKDGKLTVTEMKSLVVDFKAECADFMSKLKFDFGEMDERFRQLYATRKANNEDRDKRQNEFHEKTVKDLKDASRDIKDNLKLELETISRRSIDTAINAAKDGITENVQDIVSQIGEAVNKSQIDHRALELHKLSENHRRSQNIVMISAAGLIGLSIIVTATFTHITTRENTQVIANELVEYARKPDAGNYLQWLRMYDENHAVLLRTCGASGDKIIDKSGLCTPTIRVSDNVSRVFTGSSVMSTVENWWLSRSSYTIAFISILGTLAGLIFVPMIFNNKYVLWTKEKLQYIYKNKLFNAK